MSNVIGWIVFAALCVSAAASFAQPAPERSGGADGIYRQDLMTPQERDAYRQGVRSQRTEVERERFRQEHQRRMEHRAARAGERGGAGRSGVEAPSTPVEEAPPREDGLRRWSPGADSQQGGVRTWTPGGGSGDGLRRMDGGRRR